MKKTILSVFSLSLALIAANVILTSSSQGRANFGGSGNTGAPGESTTCRSCHGAGFGATVQIAVKDAVGNVVTDYIPGTVYTLETTVNTTSGSPSRYGFQLVSLLPGNAAYNAWSAPASNTQIATAGSRSYAEHDGPSVSNVFNASWTAPISGSGTVTFYAGGVAANLNGGTSGDGGNTTSFTLPEGTSTFLNENDLANFKAFPNPVIDELSIVAPSGLNGQLRVFDVRGKLLIKQSLVGSNELSLNLSDFESGVYFLQLENNGKLESKRLIKK